MAVITFFIDFGNPKYFINSFIFKSLQKLKALKALSAA